VARFGDGLAAGADLVVAAEQAARAALVPLAGAQPDLVTVFVCGEDPDEVAAAQERAAEVAGGRVTVGCSAGGVIGGGRGVEEARSVSVWAAVLPGVELRPFHLEVMQAPGGAAVIGMPERLESDDVVVLLADPWSFPIEGFVDQVNAALEGLPFVGGMAGGRGAGLTRLLVDGRVVDRGAVGVVIGDVDATVVVSQGCRPIGPAMTVTAAHGNVVSGLAGTAAIDRVQQLLRDLPPDEQALASTGLQVGIAMDEYADDHDTGDFLVRGIVGTQPASGALVVGGLVDVGQTVRLHVRDAATADEELHRLLGPHGGSSGALVFSCNGRGAHLFGPSHGGADHDATVVKGALRADGVAGFFAGGEIGPVSGRNHLHTFTASVLVLR
jgi:small ligand-binding sensory domain FIST